MRPKNDVKRFVVYYQDKDDNNNYIECVGDNAIFQVDGRFGIATIRSRIVTGKIAHHKAAKYFQIREGITMFKTYQVSSVYDMNGNVDGVQY